MFFLGKISKSRGNKGEVVCQISHEADFSSIDFSGEFELRSTKQIRIAKVESHSENGQMMIMKFNISNSIEDALSIVGYDVYSENLRKSTAFPKINGYSVSDIHGSSWGIVSRVADSGLNKMIETYDGTVHLMIPLDDSIVVNIDHAKKKILIDPPDGLQTLNK